MRRVSGLLCAVSVLLASLVAMAGLTASASAQEASPPPGSFQIAPGVMAEAIAFAEGREDPSVYKLTFAPDAIYMFGEGPALELAYVESGALMMTLGLPVTVTRSDRSVEQVAAGTGFTVEAGDYLILPPGTTGKVHNDGEKPASITVANLIPEGMTPPAATPAS